MTTPNTPANGGQILTDERIADLYRKAFNGMADRLRDAPQQVPPTVIAFGRAIEADLRASLAAPTKLTRQQEETIAALSMWAEAGHRNLTLNAHQDKPGVAYLLSLQSAAPAIPTVDRNGVAEEGAEILGNLIESIEKHGNYSQEATITFLSQAKQCFDEIKSAAAPAPVSGMPDPCQQGDK